MWLAIYLCPTTHQVDAQTVTKINLFFLQRNLPDFQRGEFIAQDSKVCMNLMNAAIGFLVGLYNLYSSTSIAKQMIFSVIKAFLPRKPNKTFDWLSMHFYYRIIDLNILLT